MAALYFISQGVYSIPEISDEGNLWIHGPTNEGIVLYSIVIPIICAFGICGNTLSLMVLRRRELKGSMYVYLAVLAFSDLCISILTFLSGLSRGILYVDFWPILDALLGVPLAQMFNCLSVQAVIAVMLDRTLHLRNPLRCKKPKYCRTSIARKIMLIAFILAISFNLPYFFIFEYQRGKLITREIFYSKAYYIHNWITFVIFGVIPSILLTAGNIYLVYIVHTFKRIRAKSIRRHKKQKDLSNTTITLILIIFFFLITEIPYLMVSRTSAVSFSYKNQTDTDNKTMETLRESVTVIFSFSLAVDFLLYYIFCPSFYKVLCKMLYERRRKPRKSIQMNVFVLDGEKKINEENVKTIRKIIRTNDASSSSSSSSDLYDECCKIEDNNRKTLVTICNTYSNVPIISAHI